MIEITVRDYLSGILTVPVLLEREPSEDGRYVLIQKTGSRRADRIDTATLAIQSIGPSLYEAAALNEEVKAAMYSMPDTEMNIFRVELNSDYNFTNTSTKERRYQAVFHITFKE